MNEEEIETLNKLYGQIKDFPEILWKAVNITTEKFSLPEKFYSPFNKSYEATEIIKDIRSKLIGFVIDRIEGCENFPIDTTDVIRQMDDLLGKNGFDAQSVQGYVELKYLHNADELSMKAIMSIVEMLIPVFWKSEGYGRRKPELHELVNKDTLILQCHVWEYDYPNTHRLDERTSALEKFIHIVLRAAEPSKVTGDTIKRAFAGESTQEEILRKHVIASDLIKSVRIYKNGKLKVQLNSDEEAKKVAEELIKRMVIL